MAYAPNTCDAWTFPALAQAQGGAPVWGEIIRPFYHMRRGQALGALSMFPQRHDHGNQFDPQQRGDKGVDADTHQRAPPISQVPFQMVKP